MLLLVEGEFDAMLAWQAGRDLCDVASLGAARNRVNALAAAAMNSKRFIDVLMIKEILNQNHS